MNEPEFQRVALVTGGAVRVGRAICLGLAEADYDVLVHHRSSAAEAEELVARIQDLGRRAALAAGDLREPEVARSVVEVARNTFGRLDLLVNSAASFRSGALLESDAEAWDDVMAVNVRAPHLLVRAAADLLRAAGGSVVNILDLSAFQPWTRHPVHAVSKAALAHLTRVQARVLAPTVRVNAVAPGAVMPPEEYDEDAIEALRRTAPLQKLGSPEDVVRAVLFLAQAGYVTGQILAVDGGRLLGPAEAPTPE